MKVFKEILKYIVIVVLILAILMCADKLLMPKYMTGVREGAMVAEYYEKAGDNSILFIGDCEVYENFSPVTLWEEYGITSFIRGSAQQLIWQSYYLLEEALEYETPEVVIFNVLAMKYNEPQSEAYNRMSLDGMKLSPIKIKAIQASMTEDEEMLSYIFPILRYHSRWNELTDEDFDYWFKKNIVTHSGYLMRADTKPMAGIAEYYEENPDSTLTYDEMYEIGFTRPIRYNPTMAFGENAYKYLDMITELCKEKGIQLVLIKSPSIYPYWYEQWDEEMVKYAEENELLYINMIEHIDEIGIDYTTDTYDAGLHMNLTGAEKSAKWLGELLLEKYEITDYRENEKVSKKWEEIVEYYYEMKADQERELEEYGYLKSYTLQ